ncbi:tetratricopeptide repeat protein [Seonamhaeicola algicola]|uniref:Tetratricopeptide repeat protein n=1 Tax=Seonamhaeicola algicola TaxID=1719036 RepID=A0A5C7B246_9FLAO|nr:tetratricopeptide repeat protein [Seonamhaeicola algicola]TXE14968.1 tetratricopeptide repeat protein [Seonamhaeicola algicola]
MKKNVFIYLFFIFNTAFVIGFNGNFKGRNYNIEIQQEILSNDTLIKIQNHLKLADQYKNNGQYAFAYEHLWDALLLAKQTDDFKELTTINDELGVLYGIYGRNNMAIYHKKQALFYAKKYSVFNKKALNNLTKAYYNLAVQHRKAKQYDSSLVYLDSSLFVYKTTLQYRKENPFFLAEKGNVLLHQNNIDEAENYLLKAKTIFENYKVEKNYSIVLYAFLGDLYFKKNDYSNALNFYNLSLQKIENLKAHTDLKPDVLKKASEVLKKQGYLNDAYEYLNASAKISDSLFSVRNKSNNQLFELRNKYQETIDKKQAHITKQQRIIEKKSLLQSRLLAVIALALLSTAIVIIGFYHNNKVKKLAYERQKQAIQNKHEKEKLNINLENKQKELTVSALQLIEKDKKVNHLLDIIKQKAPDIYKKTKEDVIKENTNMWERFNVRFTEVNTNFYKTLREKHPNLTPTEQKHCALIKLKFDSKEMATLLNISINSVHISRHRIRKKIGLNRDDNLTDYIADI